MSYDYKTDFGGGVILAPCLDVLCSEVEASEKYGPYLVNAGELGNAEHQKQGYASDHNPFIVHNGKSYVRAADFSAAPEHYYLLEDLRADLQALMDAGDDRLKFGFIQKDGVASNWPPPGTHSSDADFGHLHVSVTQLNGYAPSPAGWVPALDDTRPWGLLNSSPSEDDFMGYTPSELQEVLRAARVTNAALSVSRLQHQYNAVILTQIALGHLRDAVAASDASEAAQIKAIMAKIGA